MKLGFLVTAVCIPLNFLYPQQWENTDMLQEKSYDALDDSIFKHRKSKKIFIYLKAYLNKAKADRDDEELANAYRNYMHAVKGKFQEMYADSMLIAAKRTKDKDFLGSVYLSRGMLSYHQRKYKSAFDQYMVADRYLLQSSEDYLKYKLKYNIALIKYYLGYYQEAIALLKECTEYYKEESVPAYIATLHALGSCYNKTGDIERSSSLNHLALSESLASKDTTMVHYLHISEAINDYFRKDYDRSIKGLKNSIHYLEDSDDFANTSVSYYYIGKCYWYRQEYRQAHFYLKKVDSIFINRKYLHPEQRDTYELLADYYKENDSTDLLIQTLSQLLKADTLLADNYKYLSDHIRIEYDTKQIREEVRKEERKKLFITLARLTAVLAVISGGFLLSYYGTKKLLLIFLISSLQRGNELPSEESVPEFFESVRKALDEFEKSEKYLDLDVTANTIAKIVGTNPKYLATVIKIRNKRKYVDYINDLKIAYIIKLLENDPKNRRYKSQVLADYAGFSSAARFSKAFHDRMGMSLVEYIEELERRKM